MVNIASKHTEAALVLFLLMIHPLAFSKETPFSDPYFESYVFHHFDADHNGEIDKKEALKVTEIDVSQSGWEDLPGPIKKLDGIEIFINLNSLSCSNQQIIKLDLSSLTQLVDLDFSKNRIEDIRLPSKSKIKHLNGSENLLNSGSLTVLKELKKLIQLDLSANKITNINLESNPLPNLEFLNLEQNVLTQLTLRDLPNLKSVKVGGNHLISLQISECPQIKWLDCNNNFLNKLNITSPLSLKGIDCSKNRINMLNLIGFNQLKELYCHRNLLSDLYLSDCQSLETLWCGHNQLKGIHGLSRTRKLKALRCESNVITSLNLGCLEFLTEIDCSQNLIQNLELGQIAGLKSLKCEFNQLSDDICKTLVGRDSMGTLQFKRQGHEPDIYLIECK